jgi:AraC-like DNA-binding protein
MRPSHKGGHRANKNALALVVPKIIAFKGKADGEANWRLHNWRVAIARQSAATSRHLSRGSTMDEEIARPALPTATGFAAAQAIVALRIHNIDPSPLLRRAGLAKLDPEGQAGRVSALAQSKLLEYAAEALDDGALGLHLAEQADPRDAGILFYVASGAKDVNEGLTLIARYSRIVNEAARIKLIRTPEGGAVEFNIVGMPRHGARQNVEFGLAVFLKGLREVTGRNLRPGRVAFAHSRNSRLREFERFFGCPVEFGRASSEGLSSDFLEFSNEVLAIPLITADPKLVRALRPFCDLTAKERSTATGTLRGALEGELEKHLPQGKAQRQKIAGKLGLSTRTLARRLASEGTTYEEVVDQLRRSLALQYIKEKSISLSQIAWLLGYGGSASFNHAFRRWTGRSPSIARNEQRLPSPSQLVGRQAALSS